MNTAYLLLLLLTCFLVSPPESAAKSGPLVLTVDGLSINEIGPDYFEPGKLGLKSENPGYLGTALENSSQFKKMDAEIKKYSWGMPFIQDRDPQFTREAINDLKKNILQTYEVAKNDNRPLIIAGHSWGSVLTYTALRELDEEGKKDPTKRIKVDSFMTMGSPLNSSDPLVKSFYKYEEWKNTLPDDLKKPGNVNKWTNMWASGDGFSNKIPAANENIQIDKKSWISKINSIPGILWPGGSTTKEVSKGVTTLEWHGAYYKGAYLEESVSEMKEGIISRPPLSSTLQSFKGVISSPEKQGEKTIIGSLKSGYKTKDLDTYEKMDRKDLRKELEQKLGHKLNDDYDKKSKRELISELAGVPKEQIHASGNDPKKPDKQAEPKGKSLDQYEKMSKGDLRKELEKKTGEKGKYDNLSSRELISALTGTPKEQIHASGNDPKKPEKPAEPKGKSLDQYENLSKKELRKELEKKTGKSDKFDKMSKRELVSALTGIPKDKIDLDKKEKDQAKKKDDDRQKKDGGAVTKLSKVQAEEIWKARPDVDKYAHDKKAGDPYKQTQKWWDKYGQKEMGNYQFAGTPPAATPPATAASPAPAPSTPEPSPIKKLSKAQMEEVWKARPDVNENVHAKKKGDPYEKTQTWWENSGRKEMGNYQFAGTTPAATPTATVASPAPAPSTPEPSPIKKLSKAQAEEIWKARPDVNENVHAKKKGDPYEKTQTWWENYGRKEMGNYQFAGTRPPTDTPGPPMTAAPSPSPSPPVISTPGLIPSAPSPGSVAAQPPSPVPASSAPSKLGGSAKVIVGGKELQDGKYVMDNGYWEIKNGKVVSTGPLVDMRGKSIIETKDAIKLGPNDKLIIDGHETKHGYRTLVSPVKGPKGQQPGEEGLKQRGEKTRQEDQRIIKEALRPRPQELPTRAQEEGQRPAEKDRQHRAQLEEKRRKQEEGRAEQERQKQAKLEEQRRREEAKRLQEAIKREEQAKTGEKLKAQQEERKRQEAQRRVEQERQRQTKADEQRHREEQQRQRAQQEQLRRQQEQQQRAQMEQQRRQQAEQQQRLQLEQQRRQQEAARQGQAQMQQQSQIQQQQRMQPQPRQQQQPQPQKQKKQQQN